MMKNQKIGFLVVIATMLVMTTSSLAQQDEIERDRRSLEMAQHLHDRWRIEEIERAERAGPARIAREATIVRWQGNGKFDVLRDGTNGWTCMAEDISRGPMRPTLLSGPFCLDKNALDWQNAWISHTEPKLAGPGIVYVPEGRDCRFSETDPFATESSGRGALTEGPHVMLVGIKLGHNLFPTNPKSGGPWVMWAGTPYEVLIVSVKVAETGTLHRTPHETLDNEPLDKYDGKTRNGFPS
jgi:hypothetical protein